MSKPEWGTKRTCQSCSAHFYDLRKDPIVCPKCGTTYDPEAVLKSRRGRVVEKPVPVKPAPDEELPDVEAEVDDAAMGDDDDDSVMEDTSDLGEDDEDVSEIVEGGDDDQ
ncbi:MAG TPA: TIGR02300 family protein [Terriglobales bacterium]|nr:TIGR02300 family protein [Terriglobales bacterium]